MTHGADGCNNGDYSCELLSLIVLFLLSALSHFWYLFIAIGIGLFLWVGVVLLGSSLMSAAHALPRHGRCPWPMAKSRSETEPDPQEWRREVLPPLVNEIPTPSLFLTPDCNGTASLCKESDSQNQVF